VFCQLSFDSSLCRIKAAVKIQLGRGEEDKDTEEKTVNTYSYSALNQIKAYYRSNSAKLI